MIIRFGTSSIDLDEIDTIEQLNVFLEKLEGQESLLTKGNKSRIDNDYVIFDQMLPKEIAVSNLLVTLNKTRVKLLEELFPISIYQTYSLLTQINQESNLQLPAVDINKYEYMTKVTSFAAYVNSYLDLLIYSRLGFSLVIKINNDGQIYILDDIRKLHTKGVY